MCGFVGYVSKEKNDTKNDNIKKMADLIKHRGPDDDGYYVDKEVALGFRRLSIIDLKTGSQPIYNEDKSLVIVFNGEIYNYKELKEELLRKGHKFKTNTDTEVIIHGYEEYHENLFNMLRGMFAFVIYDKKKNEIVGVRDIFGIKPFYYYKNENNFMFASEIKAFLGNKDFKKEVNKNPLKMYLLFQYSVTNDTFFKDVYKLEPGSYFKYKNNELVVKKYFEIKVKEVKDEKSYDEYKEGLKKILEESIEKHKITSDVEVGSYLSGGVDSSYVAAISKPNKTYTVGFDIEGFDERKYANQLSNKLSIKNYSRGISASEFFDILPTVEYYTDEPHANLSTVPLYFLAKLASKDVKVVLSGEGADEMFLGYNEYYEPLITSLYLKIPFGLRKINGNIAKKLPKFKGRNTLIKYGKNFTERYLGHAYIMDEIEANEILNDDLKDNETTSSVLDNVYKNVSSKDELTIKSYLDFYFWLPQDILLKADKMTMANSLELRVPFLDRKVYEYAMSIPNKYLIKNKQTKYIFRDIAKEMMPNEWSKRRKLGFPVPFSKWIREEKFYNRVKEYFNYEYVDQFFDKKVINRLLDNHYNNKENNGRKIYNVFIFLVWYKKYFVDLA